jgi:hypothetical protein
MMKLALAALAAFILSACSDPAQQAKVLAVLNTACTIDGTVQPVAVSLAPIAGPAGVAAAALDTSLIHPVIASACASLHGLPAPAGAVVPDVPPIAVTVTTPVP